MVLKRENGSVVKAPERTVNYTKLLTMAITAHRFMSPCAVVVFSKASGEREREREHLAGWMVVGAVDRTDRRPRTAAATPTPHSPSLFAGALSVALLCHGAEQTV